MNLIVSVLVIFIVSVEVILELTTFLVVDLNHFPLINERTELPDPCISGLDFYTFFAKN